MFDVTHQRLEWLSDLTLLRYGKEYLRRLCAETFEDSEDEIQTVKNIIKMKVRLFSS